jgi:tetratricopeptide (TPR) repeat protein
VTLFLIVLVQTRTDVLELYRGGVALDRNDPGVAINHIERFLVRNPYDPVGHITLGYAYAHQHRYDAAEEEFRKVLKLDPNNPAAQYDLAWIYYSKHRILEAIPLFRKSVFRLRPDSDHFYDFASALLVTNQLEEAEQMAEEAVTLNPRSSRNHFLLSTILSTLGKNDRAASERSLAERLRQ